MRSAARTVDIDDLGTADRLLAATERLVLATGASTLRVRAIGLEAGVNPALVSYHFGGIQGLLLRLLERNVDAIAEMRQTLLGQAVQVQDKVPRLTSLVVAYVDPIWLAPACWNMAPARAVVRELLPAVEPADRLRVVAGINRSVAEVAKLIQPLVPQLAFDELLMRLRLLSGATEMLQPRLDALGLYPLEGTLTRDRQRRLADMLHRFALGALQSHCMEQT
jgi:AcrR family transcriptional regulator